MIRLRLQMLAPLSMRCSWKHRTSSGVAVSGERFSRAANPLAARNMAALSVRVELACSHVLDHALTQRTDSFSVAHGEFHPE
jgi:hypothetical protein